MPLWEGSVTLYSLHVEVLTPCVGPLTPHLLSPLMWLYWLWHTEHGDDDQTIKSAPKGRTIRVTNHFTGFVCLSVCVYVCTGLCMFQNVRIHKQWWTSEAGKISFTTPSPNSTWIWNRAPQLPNLHQIRQRGQTPQTHLLFWAMCTHEQTY